MAQPGVRPYFNPGLATVVLSRSAENITQETASSNLTDLTRWLKGVTYTQEANIGDATAVGDRSMGKSTGKPDNGNLDVEIMRSYSSSGPMQTLQKFVSFPALCLWTDDVGNLGSLPTTGSSLSISADTLRLAVCYITGIVHTDGNVQNADASSMSMSWPIDGDVYVPKSGHGFTNASLLTFSTHITSGAVNTNAWEILGG